MLPWLSSRWVILLMCRLWIIALWKNFVFFSPSLSHCTLDFFFHKISSCFLLSSSCSYSCSSSFINSIVLDLEMNIFWISPNLLSIVLILWSMLPKQFLFHCFSIFLKFLRRCWNLYMLEPWSISACFHQDLVSCWKSECDSQNFSKRKGLYLGGSPVSSWRARG